MRTVKLTYFKPSSGKYYAEATYETPSVLDFEIHKEVRSMTMLQTLPGLRPNHSSFIVLIEPTDGVPALILTEEEHQP